ncbi:TPA: amidohydrolase [Candidatus Bathyarchaeota archaeon]|nr:amidohydrolase [Candidatus Bathyarchaeota archaeon]
MKVIDVHNHLNPRPFLEAVRAGHDWHGFTDKHGELENPRNHWTLEERLTEMDRLGVEMQALTVYGDFNKYDRDPKLTKATVKACNDEIAAMVDEHPDRFVGLGILPMQDVAASVSELERAITELGLRGVTIKDHINGHTLDEPQFHPFWEAAERLGAVVEFHQGNTIVRQRIPRYFLENTVGNLVERTLTYGALVQGGIMDRFPRLKVCLLHGGGYVAFAVARMDKGWEAAKLDYMVKYSAEESRQSLSRPPSQYVGSFYYDCATFSEPTLRFLIDAVGIDRVVFGTDYPCPMEVVDSVDWINGLDSLTGSEKRAILSENPAKMLGI